MIENDPLSTIEAVGVVPVIEIDNEADAVLLARTLTGAGLPVVEITLRTPTAVDAIARIAAECPECLVGAGTLLTAEMVAAAAEAGARFGVSPGLSAACLAAASEHDLPFIPGVVTPSEAMAALDAGVRHVKFFPAAAYGGPPTIRALAAPLAAAGVRFLPTGGVTAANAAEYLSLSCVFAVGGTWLAPRSDIAAGRWDDIAARARAVTGIRATVAAR
jgi:2-dehydro-3-deoxyphosphogluconate aldolase / (4S)-4-hydroxy-2-oxoglutarate aldolase